MDCGSVLKFEYGIAERGYSLSNALHVQLGISVAAWVRPGELPNLAVQPFSTHLSHSRSVSMMDSG